MTDERGEKKAGEVADDARPLERALRERVEASKGAGERRGWAGLAREFYRLPREVFVAASEVYAGMVGVSLRASGEFLRAVPEAAAVLAADELRAWGEMGRRLAMADAETGANFFAAGVGDLRDVPPEARPLVFEVCARQMTLSTSVALETFRGAKEVARAVDDAETLRAVYGVAVEIARRSAKHSAEFLVATPASAASVRAVAQAPPVSNREEDDGPSSSPSDEDAPAFSKSVDEGESSSRDGARELLAAAVRLSDAFAVRAGGIAADMWKALPAALEGTNARAARQLFAHAGTFLERGGAAALHALASGGEVLRLLPGAFGEWAELLRAVAAHSNASLVALARAAPSFFQTFAAQADRASAVEAARRVMRAAREVAATDAEAGISCFRSAPHALKVTSVERFEEWAREGLTQTAGDARARRSFYALETRRSNDALISGGPGLALEEVAQTLRLYVEALTGRAVEVAPLASVPDESRIGDGRTIHLPSSVGEFDADALNFRLFKVLAAHAAGQIEFGTHERDTADLRAAFASIAETFAPENLDARDAFALDGYINDPANSEPALAPEEEARRQREARPTLPPDSDYRAVLALFPQTGLAARVFGTLENGRIDRRLRRAYRGLNRDLDLVREHLRSSRPRVGSLPVALVPFELLFEITLCGGALDDARAFYSQAVSELETIVADYLTSERATVADTLMATARVYTLFQSVVPEMQQQEQSESEDDSQGASEQEAASEEGDTVERRDEQQTEQRRADARELFNAWARAESFEGDPNELSGAERWTHGETPEQDLEEGETAFAYDEWDRELGDTRVNWCRVVEKRVRKGDRSFVEQARARHRGVISSIRHQFQLMKPESLKRVRNELDGEDYDLEAVIDYVADRRAARENSNQQSERLYTKRLRRERDVAVSFLLDQSSSTARTIGRNPLQPYTYPGRRIIEVEKEGLVLMSEALEAVGDVYAIYGFTSEGRRNVKFYVIKDFSERYSEEIERRIGGVNYQNNTRLGAAIRHAAARLRRQEARTRLLIVLSDGRPYDHDYGDARYARDDTREALRQARVEGITPFCITIDRDSEAELRDLYGEVGYTIIDNVLSLPERMPAIYRRLTT